MIKWLLDLKLRSLNRKNRKFFERNKKFLNSGPIRSNRL